jgi:protein TonB
MRALQFNLTTGTTLSVFVHIGIVGVLYFWAFGYLKHNAPTLITELDMTTVIQAQPVGKPAKPAPAWVISKKKVQPAPTPEPEKPLEKEVDTPPAGVEDNAAGVWVPAAQTARRPRWVGNFITQDDYPVLARQEGNDGRVILQVHIDTEGKIKEVKLLQDSCQILNEVAIRKVKNGIFTPAYDAQGAPVACEVILPIRFQLK